MAKVTFFPIGNADCTLIDLEGGDKVLFDFADMRNPDDEDDKRCDLSQTLHDDMDDSDVDSYRVVAFTHLDEDHYKRCSEFFWFQHAKKYQSDERIKIDTMWVPAAVITETSVENPEGRILQKEARYRLKQGKHIRVFSRPERLKKWCSNNDVDFEVIKHLITDAGNLASEFDLKSDGIEFFVHSPFAKLVDKKKKEDRNENSLVMHATIDVDGTKTKLFLTADIRHEGIDDIVKITESKANTERLEWDIMNIAHHCSYLSVGPKKGRDKTKPTDGVAKLLETYRLENGILISTSMPIPEKGSDEDNVSDPPYRQAANYYKEDSVDDSETEFLVTMQHPNEDSPKPIVIEIDEDKATHRKRAVSAFAIATGSPAPRAGRDRQ